MKANKGSKRHLPYTKEEDNYILENYKKLGCEKIAKELYRTHDGIRKRWQTLNRKGETMSAVLNINEKQRATQFVAAITIIRKIKHKDRVSATLEAVRAGWLDDIEIKIV